MVEASQHATGPAVGRDPTTFTKGIRGLAATAVGAIALLAFPAGGTAFVFKTSWGGPGGGNGELFGPTFVAADNAGHVYVTDTSNDRIEKFTASGALLRQWGTTGHGAGQLANPQGIAADRNGHVYVADQANERIDEFSANGGFIKAYGWGVVDGMSQFETCTTTCQTGVAGNGAGQLDLPTGIATDAGGTVWVADTSNFRIDKFNPTGAFVFAAGWGVSDGIAKAEICTSTCHTGISGSGPGQFKSPRGIAAYRTGPIYVTDSGNDRVEKFSGAGAFLKQWGSSGSLGGQFSGPVGVATNPTGQVFIADSNNARVEKFSSSGALIGVVGRPGSRNDEFELPMGLAGDSASNLYVVDNAKDRIEKFGNPQNGFSFGKLKRNERDGTAQLTVKLPGPGKVVLHGSGIVTQTALQAAGLRAAAARSRTLLIKAKGKAEQRLQNNGQVKLKAKVTFIPTGGVAKTRSKQVKLVLR